MQVTYWYPYIGYWGDNYKYGLDYDESRVYLSGKHIVWGCIITGLVGAIIGAILATVIH